MLYFAYGSNLSSTRLASRVPSAQLITRGQLNKHRLLFHKIGRDGSAKCDAYYTGLAEDIILGAVYQIDPDQKKHLDQAEGLGNGYEIKRVAILSLAGEMVDAFTYYATHITADIKPFQWYKEHVLRGFHEHRFPDQYIEKIMAIESVEDFDMKRAEQELHIYKTPPPHLL
jgi:gamma-glutamylcyclotransferase (GGCT)/AIG2-like uncharacterized protein YtfP